MTTEYVFTCDICQRTFERFITSEDISNCEGIVHLYREFPINWSFIHGVTVCGKHTVKVTKDAFYVDSKLVKAVANG